jgi:hypothetical protein
MAWAEIRGIRAYVADSDYNQNVEVVLFANNDGYLYQMESGNSFDGINIQTTFATPHLPISDPRKRKTFYKLFLYTDPQGSVAFDVSLKLDFDSQGTIQPAPILKLFQTQVVGSGFTVSFQFESNDANPPYSIDALTVEYGLNDRR